MSRQGMIDSRFGGMRTNLATNPSMEATSGVMEVRRNWATHGTGAAYVTTAGTNLGWNTGRWFGSGGAGTYTNVTGAVDGPIPGITSYARKTWTVQAGSGHSDTGIASNTWTGFTPGAVYTVSGWIRTSIARTSVGWDLVWGDATGTFQRATFATFTTSAGVWTRLSATVTAPTTGATSAVFILDTDGSEVTPAGGTADFTGMLVEQVGAIGAVQRTNYAVNSSFDRDIVGWAGGGAAPPTLSYQSGAGQDRSTGFLRAVSTGTTNISAYTIGTFPVTAGEGYAFSAYVRGTVGRQVALRLSWTGAARTDGPDVTLASETTWQRVSLTGVVPSGATAARLELITQATGTIVGDVTEWDAVLFERGTQSVGAHFDGFTYGGATVEYAWTGAPFASTSVQRAAATGALLPYFDGSMQQTPDPDFTTVWSGAVSASTSYITGAKVVSVDANRPAIQSSQWAAHGATSVRIIPLVAPPSTDSYFSPLGDLGTLRGGMLPGRTYTVTATIRLAAPQTGTLHQTARRIVPFWKSPSTGYITTAASAAAPNMAGETVLSTTFTLPVDASEAFVRLYNGASYGNGDVWWDKLLVEEVDPYPANPVYFDGSFRNAKWTGTANASTSIGYGFVGVV